MNDVTTPPTRFVLVKDANNRFLTLRQLQLQYVKQVYNSYFGNAARTAKALGIGRTTLYRTYINSPEWAVGLATVSVVPTTATLDRFL
jgi:DNA invertase Pin-like site-specific DNA recombinase